jgi:putative glycosyltransferase
MKLSIITTLYKSSPHIEEFYQRISKVASKITSDYELIFVNDGSPDDSLQKTLSLFENDKKIQIIELSRNYGHHKAIMTGLTYTKGDYIFLIDVDLEEEPELLIEFWNELESNKDCDVIYGAQNKRKGGWFEKIMGELSWKMINFLSPINIPINTVTARLMTKLYVESLSKYNESEIFIAGLWADVGFKQKKINIKKLSINTSTYTVKKRLSMLLDSITSFSSKPLVYIFNIGLVITLISSVFMIKILYDKLIYNISLEGWSSLILSIWFFGGLIILFLGVIGIYISRIFSEVKNRPNTTIKNNYKH